MVLSIGSIGLLWSMVDMDLDFRGACYFIRPFHAVGLLITVFLAAFIFTALSNVWRSLTTSHPALQTVMYVVSVLAVWYFILPLGDWTAIQWEEAHKMTTKVSDGVYGEFYWDDSGMACDPMGISHLLRPCMLNPLLPVMWLVFCYLVFRLKKDLGTPAP